MQEDFVSYVWKFQYFDKLDLRTADGQELTVLRTGMQNSNAGPDFSDASVRLSAITWAGSVEIHVKASDWEKHRHTTDKKYDQVILHVVWENDAAVTRTNGTVVPVLELCNRVDPDLTETYRQLRKPKLTIPCEPFLPGVNELTKTLMTERTLLERLEAKAARIQVNYKATGHNWEETAYNALLSGFGFKINQPGFMQLVKSLPHKILQKNRHQLFQTEVLLFGQSGFLNHSEDQDDYVRQLYKEYSFLKHKLDLPPAMPASDWNFLRLRPANFPTVRLAQLAALFTSREHWFSSLTGSKTLKELLQFFNVEPGDYWKTHYMPNRAGKNKIGAIGKKSVESLIINVVAPLLVAYGRETDQPEFADRAVKLLEQILPEKNRILSMYENLDFRNKDAAQSQGLLALYQGYCSPVRCLHCVIGNGILKRAKTA